ncbi:Uncharacterized protein QTN25_003754 [Entamoeba marina]
MLGLNELSHIILYLESFENVLNYYLISKRCTKAFSTFTINPIYSYKNDEFEDGNEQQLKKMLSLFPSLQTLQLQKETFQFLPTLFLQYESMILPSIFIIGATVQILVDSYEDRISQINFSSFMNLGYLRLIIQDLFTVNLSTYFSTQQHIKTLRIDLVFCGELDLQFFNDITQYHFDNIIVVCSKKESVLKILQVPNILQHIHLCCTFWFKGIHDDVIIYSKQNQLLMEEVGINNIDMMTLYNPWDIKFVEDLK